MKYFTSSLSCTDLSKVYGKANIKQYARYAKLITDFKRRFAAKGCYVASSPGRIEFIGNHTDHNGGSVIGCTVNIDIAAAFDASGNDKITICGGGFRSIVFRVNDEKVCGGSLGLAKGVVTYLKKCGYKVGGFNAVFTSDVPTGAGVSSSAAFELAIAEIISCLYNGGTVTVKDKAEAGKFAENVYFNKPCGLLDQSVIAVGGAVMMDFSSGFDFRKSVDPLPSYKFVLINSGKSHSSLNGLYAQVTDDMKAVATYFGAQRLIEVPSERFFADTQVEKIVGSRAYARARHFFNECRRVSEAENAIKTGNQRKVVELLNQSGESSRYDLKNCAAFDGDDSITGIIDFAKSICPACAARVHGGGFAGTVLCVVPKSSFDDFVSECRAKYGNKHVLTLSVRNVGTMAF